MSLEEAIRHLEELIEDDKFDCQKCREEHKQLLIWLNELKWLRCITKTKGWDK